MPELIENVGASSLCQQAQERRLGAAGFVRTTVSSRKDSPGPGEVASESFEPRSGVQALIWHTKRHLHVAYCPRPRKSVTDRRKSVIPSQDAAVCAAGGGSAGAAAFAGTRFGAAFFLPLPFPAAALFIALRAFGLAGALADEAAAARLAALFTLAQRAF